MNSRGTKIPFALNPNLRKGVNGIEKQREMLSREKKLDILIYCVTIIKTVTRFKFKYILDDERGEEKSEEKKKSCFPSQGAMSLSGR